MPAGSLSSCKRAGRILLLSAGLAAAGLQLVALGSDIILKRNHLHLNRSQVPVDKLCTSLCLPGNACGRALEGDEKLMHA